MAQQAQFQQAPPPRRRNSGSSGQREERASRAPREPERVFPDSKLGLTAAQAAGFLEQGLGNEMPDAGAKSTAQIVREKTLTFFDLVFVVLAALLIMAGDFKHM
ncbi:MAG: hypothetical protein K2K53_11620, partial [Oscillospiraceae bacterium]|nr:hypothetical protein [Oscillospiraceae bacterium]